MINDAHETSNSDDRTDQPSDLTANGETSDITQAKEERNSAEKIGRVVMYAIAVGFVGVFAFFGIQNLIVGDQAKSGIPGASEILPVEEPPRQSHRQPAEDPHPPGDDSGGVGSEYAISSEERYADIDAFLDSIDYETAGEVIRFNYHPATRTYEDAHFSALLRGEEPFEILKARILEQPNLSCSEDMPRDRIIACDPRNNKLGVHLQLREDGDVRLVVEERGVSPEER